MMPARYSARLHTPGGTTLADLSDFSLATLAKSRDQAGAGTMTLAYSAVLASLLSREQLVEVTRNGARVFETLWVIKRIRMYYDAQGGRWIDIGLVDLARLVGWSRIVAYAAGSSQSDKSGPADDVCKAIVRENVGASVTDATRQMANLSVAADSSAAASVSKGFSWRVMGDVLNELCASSIQAGTYCAWDVVCTGAPGAGSVAFEFRTYTGQRGADHRYPSGTAGALWLAADAGNIRQADTALDYSTEGNAIYAGGKGSEAARNIQTAISAQASATQYARSEKFISATGSTAVDDTAYVLAEANAALWSARARWAFYGRLMQTDGCQFGRDYGYGDYVTAQAFGLAFDCRIDAVQISISRDNGEQISAQLRSD